MLEISHRLHLLQAAGRTSKNVEALRQNLNSKRSRRHEEAKAKLNPEP